MVTTSGVLISIILVIVTGIIALGIQTGFIDFVDQQQSESLCKNSVRAHRATMVAGVVKTNDIICPTNHVEIKNNVKDEDALNLIANEMYTCWDNFLRGGEDLFGAETTYCSICSIIEFQDEERELSGIYNHIHSTTLVQGGAVDEFYGSILEQDEQIRTYGDFLHVFKSPKYYEHGVEEITISNFEGGPGWEGDAEDLLFTLDNVEYELTGDRPYAVIFRYAKGQESAQGVARFYEDVTGSVGMKVLLGGGTKTFLTETSGSDAPDRDGEGLTDRAREVARTATDNVGTLDIISVRTTPVLRQLSGWASTGGMKVITSVKPLAPSARFLGPVASKAAWPLTVAAMGDVFRVAESSQDRDPEWVAQTILIDYTEEAIEASGCQYIATRQE